MGFPLVLAKCAASTLELHLLIDGELADDDAVADIRGHVAGCADCRQQWNGLVSTRQLLAASHRHDAIPADVYAALVAVIDEA